VGIGAGPLAPPHPARMAATIANDAATATATPARFRL
jgi:hypothetical protein